MSDPLTERLNQILPRIISDEFLSGSGIGNEIAFYIFDYPPEDELRVREHLAVLARPHPQTTSHGLRVKHINLFDFVMDYLRQRKLLDKAIQMQQTKGDAFVLKQFSPVAASQQNRASLCRGRPARPARSGARVGRRQRLAAAAVHTLLNNLHAVMGKTPLVLVLSRPVRRPVAPAVRQAPEQQLLPGFQTGSVRLAAMLIKNLLEETSSAPSTAS